MLLPVQDPGPPHLQPHLLHQRSHLNQGHKLSYEYHGLSHHPTVTVPWRNLVPLPVRSNQVHSPPLGEILTAPARSEVSRYFTVDDAWTSRLTLDCWVWSLEVVERTTRPQGKVGAGGVCVGSKIRNNPHIGVKMFQKWNPPIRIWTWLTWCQSLDLSAKHPNHKDDTLPNPAATREFLWHCCSRENSDTGSSIG